MKKQETPRPDKFAIAAVLQEIAALMDTSEAAARRSAADGIAKLRASYGKEPNR